MKESFSHRFHIQIPDQRWFEENIGCENACPVNTRAPQYISAIREENYDLVSGWKKKRYDNTLTKNLPSRLFNWTARNFSGIKLHDIKFRFILFRSLYY